MRALPPDRVRELDRVTIDELGIPGLILMENAGSGAFEVAREMLERRRQRRIVALAGKGNNAGDAFVVARHAANAGIESVVVLICGESAFQGDSDAAINLRAARASAVRIVDGTRQPPLELLREVGGENALIIDGLLGTGAKGAPRPPFSDWIEAANELASPILALDLPSGLDAATGEAAGAVISAEETATFAVAKTGLLSRFAASCTGRIRVISISIPKALIDQAFD